ncbi:hypothetical protein JYU34_016029 [Plutella xylostella]|uniref:Uncharacterized protein n=1 Tax=Plutella xylostella TaxID=51655 RepID=A0ABQ7Q5A4_PLUXY|nr:hypothetical protein JYU34_016029 [Plutella xylostella]
MFRTPEKASSESNLTEIALAETPKMNFGNLRNKRKRSEESSCDLTEFKAEIKNMLSTWMTEQGNERKQISSSLKSIEESISFLSAQYDDMKKKMDIIEQEKKRDREYILFLEDKVEDLQKASRKCSMELKNVPKIKNENKEILSTMVTHLSSQLKVDLETKDIKDIYRTSSKADKTPIVVEFSSYILKTDLMNAAKKYNIMNKNNKLNASHLGQQSNSTPHIPL